MLSFCSTYPLILKLSDHFPLSTDMFPAIHDAAVSKFKAL